MKNYSSYKQKTPAAALNPFDNLLFKHLGYTFNRTARSFAYAFTGGSSAAPQSAVGFHPALLQDH